MAARERRRKHDDTHSPAFVRRSSLGYSTVLVCHDCGERKCKCVRDDTELAQSVAKIIGPQSAAQAALNRQAELAAQGFVARIFADDGVWLVTEPSA